MRLIDADALMSAVMAQDVVDKSAAKRLILQVPTEEQYAWIARLRKEGYAATVCCGYEEARKTIEEYLG